MVRVLVIEDEIKLAQAIQKGLEEEGYEVEVAYNAESAAVLAKEKVYSVIVSDVILPGDSGIDLLKNLRAEGNTIPVLLLTALGQIDDKEIGFIAGADDYLSKPFEFRELLLRVKALTRRTTAHYQAETNVLKYEALELNLGTKELFISGNRITLTPREYGLMEYFLRHPERVISKKEIAEQVWDIHFDTGTNVVEVYVNFLRKKIEKDLGKRVLHTQFGNGYMLRG
jgi:two-component system copper resistance phosphate regulon response regulator CusR